MRVFFFYIFIFLSGIDTLATHIRAGEITVKVLDCNTNTYQITITGYTDTGSDVEFGNGQLDFGDGSPVIEFLESSSLFSFKKSLNNNVAVTQFTTTHSFPRAGEYIIKFYERNRTDAVVNMVNSVSTPFYIETVFLIDPQFGCNNSPVLTFEPIDYGYIGKTFFHNAGAYDIDGDSLSYEIIINKKSFDTYVDGYKFPNDPSFGGTTENENKPATFTIDEYGTLIWDSPGIAGEYNLAFGIQEWRKTATGKWRKVGAVTRDMQVIVQEDGANEQFNLDFEHEIFGYVGQPISQEIFMDIPANEEYHSIIEAQGDIFVYEQLNAKFDYDSVANIGMLALDLSCYNYFDREYVVYYKASTTDLSGLTTTHYKTQVIKIIDPLNIEGVLSKEDNAVSINLAQLTNETFERIQIWRHDKSKMEPLWLCAKDLVDTQKFSLKKEVESGIITVLDEFESNDNELCYVLIGINSDNEKQSIFRGCIDVNNRILSIEKDKGAQIKVFPNPAQIYINVKFEVNPKDATIRILDLLGKPVRSLYSYNPEEVVINIEDLKRGLYIISVKFGDEEIKKKLMKY